jgi:hypothetical protein
MPYLSLKSIKVIPPKSRFFCTQPLRDTCSPTFFIFNSPQVFVLNILFFYLDENSELCEKARKLGREFVIQVKGNRVRVRRGGRKRPVAKGILSGKPSSVGINQLKPTRNLRSKAEERVGRAIGGLRVLNSYWIAQDGTYKYY